MKTLPPLPLHDRYYSLIEDEIRRIFDTLIYRPLLDVMGMHTRDLNRMLKNSKNALLDAIAKGTIWYDNGQFHGQFNAKTSAAIIKLGGIYNVKARTYSLPLAKLPTELKFAQAEAQSKYEKMREKMLSIIDNIQPSEVDKISKTKGEYEKTMASIEVDLQKTMPKNKQEARDNPAASFSRLAIDANITPKQREIIAEQWGQNLDLYIKNWTEKNILKLREEIQPHVMAGGRAEGLAKVIQENYGVSARKAKFLALQETSLLMSKYKETRYKDIGISKYRWSDSHDARVRHDHHELNGKIFSYDNPPITNRKTGARNNPGCDYGCRCIDIPVID